MRIAQFLPRLLGLTALLGLAACSVPEPLPDPQYDFSAKAHNIILFIGDGMGPGPRTAAQWVKVGMDGKLAMDDMPASGWSRTWNAAGKETDSAAGATAIATGQKVGNGVLSLDPQLQPLPTVLELARDRGKAVGLVTTTELTDATPAAFAAHVRSRALHDAIAEQMITAGVDLMLGGGEDKFLPPTQTGCHPGSGARQDRRNVVAEASLLGYIHLCQPSSLGPVDPAAAPRLLGLFADGLMPRPVTPTLAAMTEKAIDILALDPDGFFLMVEGGLIDKAGHNHDASGAIQETLALDQAVAVAKAYAATAPQTLIIVTADHDTGGMEALPPDSGEGGQGPFHMPDGTPFYVRFTESGHSMLDVPVTAQGPSSGAIQGSFENTYVNRVMVNALE